MGIEDGLPRPSVIRCDFLALLFKRKLTTFVCSLSAKKIAAVDRALATALDLPS